MVDEEEFAPYVPLIQATAKALMKAVIDQRARDGGKGTINVQHLQSVLESRKLAALNRTSFKQIMTKLFRYIGFDPGREITPFVQCRNSLVHRGHFYATTATEAQRRACPPLATLQEEYLFLVSFLDRVFLKLLGYSGEYIDYRLPWEGFGRKRMI